MRAWSCADPWLEDPCPACTLTPNDMQYRVSAGSARRSLAPMTVSFPQEASSSASPLRERTDQASSLPASRRLSPRSEEHTSELQSLMRISYAVFCLKKKKTNHSVNEINLTYHQTNTQ